jgi:guanylate kinase
MVTSLLGNFSRGQLFILSAPAGTGKTTLVQLLTRDFACVVASISYTTREPRPGEVDGIHYYFISKDEFLKRVEIGEFLEYVELYGDYYGTSKIWVDNQLEQGKHVILVIDTQGAALLKNKIQATTIFVAPPSMEELERRLTLRQTESQEVIEKRLEWAKKEIQAQKKYDYLIVNDDLSNAYQALRSILIAEEHRIR